MTKELQALELILAERDKKMLDRFEQAIIAVRESTNPNLSDILKEMKNNDTKLKDDIAELKESLKPLLDEYNASKGFWSRFFFFSKVAGAVTAIGAAFAGVVWLSRRI